MFVSKLVHVEDGVINVVTTTKKPSNSISVTAIWVEEEIDGEWEAVLEIDHPEIAGVGSFFSTSATIDMSKLNYSSMFRVGVTMDADGYTESWHSESFKTE